MRFDRKQFFNGYRKQFGKLRVAQVDGLSFLLDKLEKDTFTLEQSAYILATVAHETGRAFQPIKEKRGRVGTKIRKIQDKYWGTEAWGRGFIQITWPANYAKFGLGPGEYDKALEPEKAYEILSVGMRKGVFTGKKLTDYIIAGSVDYVHARKIVNGLDRANDIAEIADKFETILHDSLVTDSVTEPEPKADEPEVVEPEAEEPKVEPAGPQINVEHADEVKTETPAQPIDGGRKDDEPKQASQGGKKSLLATIFGAITGVGAAVGGWTSSNTALAIVGVVGVVLVMLALIFRQLIMDYFRLKYMSDPTKINVK